MKADHLNSAGIGYGDLAPLMKGRIYLNDHYSPATGRLNGICRKLLKEKMIVKFKMLNTDKPMVRVMRPDGTEVVLDAVACAALLKSN